VSGRKAEPLLSSRFRRGSLGRCRATSVTFDVGAHYQPRLTAEGARAPAAGGAPAGRTRLDPPFKVDPPPPSGAGPQEPWGWKCRIEPTKVIHAAFSDAQKSRCLPLRQIDRTRWRRRRPGLPHGHRLYSGRRVALPSPLPTNASRLLTGEQDTGSRAWRGLEYSPVGPPVDPRWHERRDRNGLGSRVASAQEKVW
jgi:hypothetical protein